MRKSDEEYEGGQIKKAEKSEWKQTRAVVEENEKLYYSRIEKNFENIDAQILG